MQNKRLENTHVIFNDIQQYLDAHYGYSYGYGYGYTYADNTEESEYFSNEND